MKHYTNKRAKVFASAFAPFEDILGLGLENGF